MAKKNENRFSLRLDEKSKPILEQATATGISKTKFINKIIQGASLSEQKNLRNVQSHLARMQTLLEFCEDLNAKKEMREELNNICQYLKS